MIKYKKFSSFGETIDFLNENKLPGSIVPKQGNDGYFAYWFEGDELRSFLSSDEQDGVSLIWKERYEQIYKHKRTVERDAEYKNDELISAVRCLLDFKYAYMPDQWDEKIVENMMSKSYLERLIYAGAFIAAKIDTILYLEKQKLNQQKEGN